MNTSSEFPCGEINLPWRIELQRVSVYLEGHHEEVVPVLGGEHIFEECSLELSSPE